MNVPHFVTYLSAIYLTCLTLEYLSSFHCYELKPQVIDNTSILSLSSFLFL